MGLTLAKVRAGGERYYLQTVPTGLEDHRGPGREPDGQWVGRGCDTLGLAGPVTGAALAAVMHGLHPAGEKTLRPNGSRVGVAAIDLTFGAPKSVSVLFGVAGDDVAAAVRAAHEAAALSALRYLEGVAVVGRRRTAPGGPQQVVATKGAVAAAFLHRTSRALDPHLHTHALVANLVSDLEGQWSALDARRLFAEARTAGLLYEAHLRRRLTERLGVAWAPARNGRADIEGIPTDVLRAFSGRQRQVQEHLALRSMSGWRAARVAVLATRAPKDLTLTHEALSREWRERALALRFGPREKEAVLGRAGPVLGPPLGAAPPRAKEMAPADRAAVATTRLERLAREALGRSETADHERASLRALGEEADALAARLAPAIPAGAGSTSSWAAAHRDELARYAVLRSRMRARSDTLARLAERRPPPYLLGEIGSPPVAGRDLETWRLAARRVESYRERWGLSTSRDPLGARDGRGTAAARQLVEREDARRVLASARELFRPEIGLSLERARERYTTHSSLRGGS